MVRKRSNTKSGDKSNSSKPTKETLVQFPVVGIGASAGGLQAFKDFFKYMPEDCGIAFILVQHLDPTHKSMMTELLRKYTRMEVLEIKDGMTIHPNKLYMIAPNKFVKLSENKLLLSEPIQQRGMRMPIDFLFYSMAAELGERAICVILSGTGSDGTFGLSAIKNEGGTAFVQNPESAQYNGMPNSAISTNLVDFSMPIEELPKAIIEFISHSPLYKKVDPEDHAQHEDNTLTTDFLTSVLSIIKANTNHDFRGYKHGTLRRRVLRRMGLAKTVCYADYISLLRQDPKEVKLLLRDLLIGVTAFFRDHDAWDTLEKNALEQIMQKKSSNDTIRAWIPGCSTGEEAYTMAILFLELQERFKKEIKLQIFASDIDESALEVARNGLYPKTSLENMDKKRVNRFFTEEHNYYRTSKELRGCVIFAQQNVITDPPFSKIDIISCRNLLIYLNNNIHSVHDESLNSI